MQRIINKYVIDYKNGIARLYTPSYDWEDRFYTLANQCFGIRKSIDCEYVKLIEMSEINFEPEYYEEYERLEHSGGDVIVWNEKGEKIKSEWD